MGGEGWGQEGIALLSEAATEIIITRGCPLGCLLLFCTVPCLQTAKSFAKVIMGLYS